MKLGRCGRSIHDPGIGRAGNSADHSIPGDLTDPVGNSVRQVDIPGAIDRDIIGITEFRRGGRSVDISELAIAGEGADHSRRGDLSEEVIIGVGDIYIPVPVQGYSGRSVELGNSTRSIRTPRNAS